MPQNVLLLTVDCFRADRLAAFGHTRNTMPFFESLADNGFLFRQAFTTGPGTTQGFQSLFSSSYPLDYNTYMHQGPNRDPIAVVLSDHGVATAGVHSNSFLTADRGFNRGFDRFRSFRSENEPPRFLTMVKQLIPDSGPLNRAARKGKQTVTRVLNDTVPEPYQPAPDVVDTVVDYWRDLETPFFIWGHFMDAHSPHKPPRGADLSMDANRSWLESHQRWTRGVRGGIDVTDTDRELWQAAYDAELEYVDGQLERLFSQLTADGLAEDTWVVVTGDHGELLGDGGAVGHTPRMDEPLLHVPLLVVPPQDHKVETPTDGMVTLLDVPTTILSIFGIEPPETYRGRDLMAGVDREVVASEVGHRYGEWKELDRTSPSEAIVCVRHDEWKLVSDRFEGTTEYRRVIGPGREVVDEPDQETRELLCDLLESHIADIYSGDETARVGVDDVAEDRMRQLGYLE